MLAEFLIELKLDEEQDRITQIVTGSNVLRSTQCMMSTSVLVKGKCLLKEKAKEELIEVESPIGAHLVMSSGSQMVAHKDTAVQSIIQGESQGDVQSVALRVTIHLNVHVQSLKAKNAEWDDTAWQQEEVEWQEHSCETDSEEHEASKRKKGKGTRSKSKGKSKGKGTPRSITPRPSQSQPSRTDGAQPKAKPEARSCATNDFRFA